nr:unnamed protein product [Callosobruchus analis]
MMINGETINILDCHLLKFLSGERNMVRFINENYRHLNTESLNIVQLYYENNHSILVTQRAYRDIFDKKMSHLGGLYRFQGQGSVSDLRSSGRPRSALSIENIERVQEGVREDPETSTRRRSTQLELSRSSLRRILRHLCMFRNPTSSEFRKIGGIQLKANATMSNAAAAAATTADFASRFARIQNDPWRLQLLAPRLRRERESVI